MFKSVFVKYISAFMLINILSLFLSTSIITTLMTVYDENDKDRVLSNVAYGTTTFMIDDYVKSGDTKFSEYLDHSVYEIVPILNAMAANAEETVIFVTDGEGNVKIVGGSEDAVTFAGEDGIINAQEAIRYPRELLEKMRSGEKITGKGVLEGFFDKEVPYHVQPITTRDGVVVGSVMTCILHSNIDALLEATIKTIIMSSLWLMLAALIAVYFMTERLVSPLRAMSRAAKEFAAGHFDVRVEVSGNDEVAELAEAFNNMAEALKNSDETRRLFLANVSHDLRTPMTTIKGFIDNILEGTIPQDKVPHYLSVIKSEVDRLAKLVSSLLDITKIQAGERKFNKTPFDICEMARQILISFEQKIDTKNLDVEFDCDSEKMFALADRDAIYQILYNICDNGVKFSKNGGKYKISIVSREKKIYVSVYNEGQGIPESDLPHVFDRFYKSDKSRGLDKTGVGLGLYIAKTIIDAHDEEIWVKSSYGNYCEFVFTLTKTHEVADKPKTDKFTKQ